MFTFVSKVYMSSKHTLSLYLHFPSNCVMVFYSHNSTCILDMSWATFGHTSSYEHVIISLAMPSMPASFIIKYIPLKYQINVQGSVLIYVFLSLSLAYASLNLSEMYL